MRKALLLTAFMFVFALYIRYVSDGTDVMTFAGDYYTNTTANATLCDLAERMFTRGIIS